MVKICDVIFCANEELPMDTVNLPINTVNSDANDLWWKTQNEQVSPLYLHGMGILTWSKATNGVITGIALTLARSGRKPNVCYIKMSVSQLLSAIAIFMTR